MTVTLGIDTCHLTTEELPMSRCVSPLIDSDIVMNHLMEDGVLNKLFRQVDAGIDTQHEVLVPIPPEETLLAAGESDLAEETFGVRKPDRDRR